MSNKINENTSIIPLNIDFLGLDNVIIITEKILKNPYFDISYHFELLNEEWNLDYPIEWREILEIHIIIAKLGVPIDTKSSIHHQYKNLFNVDYKFQNKTDYNYLKKLKLLNLRTSNYINNLEPIKYFENLIELSYYSESKSILGIENIGFLSKLEILHLYIPYIHNIDFLQYNSNVIKLSLITGNIFDYSFLGSLMNLEALYFSPNILNSDHSVFKLINLKELTIMNCRKVEDINYFKHLINLEELSAYYLEINNIEFLKAIPVRSLRIRNGGLSKTDINWLQENIPDLILL